jgi:hypothetical protein
MKKLLDIIEVPLILLFILTFAISSILSLVSGFIAYKKLYYVATYSSAQYHEARGILGEYAIYGGYIMIVTLPLYLIINWYNNKE